MNCDGKRPLELTPRARSTPTALEPTPETAARLEIRRHEQRLIAAPRVTAFLQAASGVSKETADFLVCCAMAKIGALAPNASATVEAASPPADPPLVLTPMQTRILEALDGCALTVEKLAVKIRCERQRLYKQRDLKELQAHGRVAHKRGLGYYRPDAPPPESEKAKRRATK